MKLKVKAVNLHKDFLQNVSQFIKSSYFDAFVNKIIEKIITVFKKDLKLYIHNNYDKVDRLNYITVELKFGEHLISSSQDYIDEIQMKGN